MNASASPELQAKSAEDAASSAVDKSLAKADAEGVSLPALEASRARGAVFCSIDFAMVVGEQFIVYGWVLGFARSVGSASIEIGSAVIDLVKHATPVRRPDVANHFSMTPGNDEHGFYALVSLPGPSSGVESFKLSVTLSSGETSESLWPVSCFETGTASVIEPHVATLNRLLPRLSKHEARRLIEFGSPALGLSIEKDEPPGLPFTVRFGIDMCCVLENRILVVSGWRDDPLSELTKAVLCIGESKFQLLEGAVPFSRSDINPDPSISRRRKAPEFYGFNFVRRLPLEDADVDEALFTFSAGAAAELLTQPVSHNPNQARRELLLLVNKMESESALVLIDLVASALDADPSLQFLSGLLDLLRQGTIERLPSSIQQANPRYFLHVDQAIPVADVGLFLLGWFNASSPESIRIECHRGSSTFVVSDHWSRHARADVSAHLVSAGIPNIDHSHGFSCYVPLSGDDSPPYISAASRGGVTRRMRVSVREQPESALQTVRALVTSFGTGHPELRFLLDHQIGPAVGAAWAARSRLLRPQAIRHYGPAPSDPSISIIVPLYGRYDFAEYQMALFADDPEFRSVELIYVVDDPEILADFTNLCTDLYGMYQVPFVSISPGVNLGFAGANNFAAKMARGKYLLFLNSDVMPKRPLWCGELLRTYNSLPNPGVLGAKLLYEDGSVQHAGMAFRRYPDWGDLWINDHPYKGQSSLGLEGVRESPAVTAACALVKAALFRKLGGFSEDYIVGDFEDSDLCLRASSAGRRNYIDLDVELYHVERQSQNRMGDDTWRTNLTLYNCWLHNSRWGEAIEGFESKRMQQIHAASGGRSLRNSCATGEESQ